jgi:hypothetical protein
MTGNVFCGGEDCAEEFAGEETMQTGRFGEGNELVWRDEAALRMLPAGEGFEAAKKTGAKFNEWLKIRNDLVIFERSAQIGCVFGGHGTDDTTAYRTYTVNFRVFQRETRSRAALVLNKETFGAQRPCEGFLRLLATRMDFYAAVAVEASLPAGSSQGVALLCKSKWVVGST